MRDATRAKIPSLYGAIWRTILNLYASQGVWVNCYRIHQKSLNFIYPFKFYSNFTNKNVSWLHFSWATQYSEPACDCWIIHTCHLSKYIYNLLLNRLTYSTTTATATAAAIDVDKSRHFIRSSYLRKNEWNFWPKKQTGVQVYDTLINDDEIISINGLSSQVRFMQIQLYG